MTLNKYNEITNKIKKIGKLLKYKLLYYIIFMPRRKPTINDFKFTLENVVKINGWT